MRLQVWGLITCRVAPTADNLSGSKNSQEKITSRKEKPMYVASQQTLRPNAENGMRYQGSDLRFRV